MLDQADQKLHSHIFKVFGNEKDGIAILFNSISGYFFIGIESSFNGKDQYSLDIVGYIFDQFIISSSEFSTVPAPLPKIETWRNWICTCVLLEFSTDLMKLSTVSTRMH